MVVTPQHNRYNTRHGTEYLCPTGGRASGGRGVSIIMRLLRQPLIIGYIISGIICGPAALNLLHDAAAFESFSQIGIALLLFIVGLGLNVGVIKRTGKPVLAILS